MAIEYAVIGFRPVSFCLQNILGVTGVLDAAGASSSLKSFKLWP